MKKFQKIMSLLLCLIMVLTMFPVSANAADGDVAKIGDTTYATLADAVSAAAAGDTIVLIADSSFSTAVTVTKKITIKAESPVTLTKTGTNEWLLIKAGGDVTLEGPITVKGTSGKYGALIEVASKGILTMNAGVTLKDNSTNEGVVGPGVNITDGTFIMNGGTITNCANTGSTNPASSTKCTMGGAVRVGLTTSSTANASFTMNGGTISNCSSYLGGAVGVDNLGNTKGSTASFTMNGGTITGCSQRASSSGKRGGSVVYISNKLVTGSSIESATFVMNGGTITGNTAKYNGAICTYVAGGLMGRPMTYGAHVYILGGTISGNVSGNGTPGSGYGNGIYVEKLVNGASALTIGGNAVIDSEIHLGSATGNYFEILDNFTGSVKVYSQAGGTGGTPVYGTLVAKQVSSTGVTSTATKEIAGKITAVYGQSLDANGKVYEHPVYDIVLGTNADEYVLGEYATEEPETPPAAPNVENASDSAMYIFVCSTKLPAGIFHQPTGIAFDTGYSVAGEPYKNADGEWIVEVTNKVKAMWEEYTGKLYAIWYPDYAHTSEELPETLTVTLTWDSEEEKWFYLGEPVYYDISCEVPAPEAPNGNNVTTNLVTMICDTDAAHEPVTTKWQSGTIVYPTNSEPVWDEELGTWTIGIRIDMIGTKYVWPYFEEKYNDINHDLVASDLVNTEFSRIDTKLKWDETSKLWVTLDGKPIEIHLTCQTKPEAPEIGYFLSRFQIKVVGEINGVEKVWANGLDRDSVVVGEVKGNRADGFTCDITVTLAQGDSYFNAWVAKHNPANDYIYDWSKTEQTVTFTMKYVGDTAGTIYDGPEYWTADGETVYTAYVTMEAPAVPEKHGGNVTEDLVTIICDTDPNHHPVLTGKWYNSPCKIFPTNSEPVWDAELGAWTIGIRIQQLDAFYTDEMWDTYGVYHDHVNGVGSVEDDMIVATLKWDENAQLWVPTETIELHTACKAKPDAPEYIQLKSYQVQVNGDVDHDGVFGEPTATNNGVQEQQTTSIPEGAYTLSEVYGSREEGFFIDVTFELADNDLYFQNWVAACANGKDYVYDWDKTGEKVITFTLEYTGDLNGTLYGHRHGSNQGETHYDWVLTTTGKHWGAVAEAYVKEDIPMPNVYIDGKLPVAEELLTVYCDSDPDRHQPVTGPLYRQHSYTDKDTFAWNAELNTWTIDIRIDSLYTMYVSKLEKANGNTQHTIVGEDTRSIYTTLKWDYAQNLWVPVEAVELHTECRTAPVAPVYEHQLYNYQVKVYGDVDHDGVLGEIEQNNKGVGEVFTVSMPEDGYTIGEVYGSREEGFFVDVTITIAEDDVYQQGWVANCNPNMLDEYYYDWTKTPETVTFTLKYNGDLNGTLHGDRYADNTNVDWVLTTTGKDEGVIAEAYLTQETYPTTLIIYRNGDTSAPYLTVELDELAKGQKLDLTAIEIADYYTASEKYNFYGWYDADLWSKYIAGEAVEAPETVTAAGETVLYAMVKDVYTVTFNTKGGSAVESQEVEHGAVAVQPENPTKTGCFFVAWRTATTKKYDFATPVTGDLELIAMWGVPGTNDDEQKPDPKPEEDEGCEQDYTCPLIKYSDLRVRAWYHDGVHYCLEKGIMDGIGNGKFAPAEITNRAMIVTILWRLEGKPASEADMTFTDVAEGQWYTEAVRWAAENEIVEGYSETAFGPLDTVTREQMAVILYRYAKYKGYDVSAKADLSAYTDADEVSAWAVEAMEWAVGCKLIQGLTATRLAPSQGTTRAQVATLIYRFATANEKK